MGQNREKLEKSCEASRGEDQVRERVRNFAASLQEPFYRAGSAGSGLHVGLYVGR